MLVLSRGQNDKVVFPTLGISVEIIRVAGKKVRLGIEAPEEIPVHRHEVCERIQAKANAGEADEQVLKFPEAKKSLMARLNHDTRNRLNAAALGLHLLHRKLENGDLTDAESTIFTIFNELKGIESLLEEPAKTPAKLATQKSIAVRWWSKTTTTSASCWPAICASAASTWTRPPTGCRPWCGSRRVHRTSCCWTCACRGSTAEKRSPPSATIPDYRGLKLFAVSGTKPEEMNVALGPNGVDRWFTKPLDPKTLIDALYDELHTERILA